MTGLAAFIPMDRRLALAAGRTLRDRTHGTALFADVSGFTALTGALAQAMGRKRGAEAVLRYINPVFDALIVELHRYRGSVIGFAGDSITCWFDVGDADADAGLAGTARRALSAATAMQQAMRQFAQVMTPDGTAVPLAIKVALASGPARRFVVGEPTVQRIDVLAGGTLEAMAAAEGLAGPGDIIATRPAVDLLGAAAVVTEWRSDDVGRPCAILTPAMPAEPDPWPQAATLPDAAVREWVLPPVYARATIGMAFLGELRPVTALFGRFQGIDFDGDPDAGALLDRFVRWVQSILARYGGTLVQLTIGDKGSFFYAAFGAPLTVGDDTARAMAAALDCHARPAALDFIASLQIGVSRGQVWSGTCGATARYTFGVMGNQVNMAARLMGKAQPGQTLVNAILVDEVGGTFYFEPLDPIQVKGRQAPLPVALLSRRRRDIRAAQAARFDTPLFGRDDLVRDAMTHLTQAAAGRARRMWLVGPAGIGKSHIAAVVAQQAADAGWQVATALCHSVNQATIYSPWQQLMQQLFALPAAGERGAAEDTPAAIEQLERRLRALNPAWLLRLPLLGDLLGLPIPDNATTAAFDPQLRQASLFALVVEILTALAAEAPLLLVVDDLEWADAASLALVDAVDAGLAQAPLALLLTQQRAPAETAADASTLAVPALDATATADLVTYRLGDPPTPLLVDLVLAQTLGNPHFVRELIALLREAEQVAFDGAAWDLSADLRADLQRSALLRDDDGAPRLAPDADLKTVRINIPDSVFSLVLARFDRLPERQKLTLKVASVIGQVFQLDVVVDLLPESVDLDQLKLELLGLAAADFVAERSFLVHLFKYSTAHEVAYETLLFAQRRALHEAVASWYEAVFGHPDTDALDAKSPLAPHYGVLAFHWRHAENQDRERIFAALAGHYAAANYANVPAIHHFTRALELTDAAERAERFALLTARERVYDWQGQRPAQLDDLQALEAAADALDDDARRAAVRLRWANYYRWTGDYAAAAEAAARAETLAAAAGETTLAAEALFLRGRLLRIQRQYAPARDVLEQALAAALDAGLRKVEADCRLDLGSVRFFLGDHAGSIADYQAAQALYEALDEQKDRAGALVMQALAQDNLGRYGASRALLQQALGICRTIGYRVGESNILGNLGVNYEFVGQYAAARQMQEQALAISRSLDDVEGESFALSNLALLHGFLGDAGAAEAAADEALARHRQLGDRRSEGFTLTYLGHAHLSADRVDAARAAYAAARDLRHALGEPHLAIDCRAGLIDIDRLTGRLPDAVAEVETILAWIDENGVAGIEYPLRVYQSCYAALQAAADPRAGEVLAQALALLDATADGIRDAALRDSFRHNIAANAALAAAR